MKTTILPFVSAILLAGGLVSSCDSKENDPQKKANATSHVIEVRYQGANLTSALDAKIQGGSSLPDGTQTENGFNRELMGSPSGTVAAGTVSEERDFYTTVTFYGIKPPNKIPASAYVTFDVYVDGVKKRTGRLDNTSTAATFPSAKVAIYTREWDNL